MDKYRKKPVEIEAVQWDGTAIGANAIIDWALELGGSITYHCDWHEHMSDCNESLHSLMIKTLEGHIFASSGDWVIRGVEGEFYPCKPSVFESTYEKVN